MANFNIVVEWGDGGLLWEGLLFVCAVCAVCAELCAHYRRTSVRWELEVEEKKTVQGNGMKAHPTMYEILELSTVRSGATGKNRVNLPL